MQRQPGAGGMGGSKQTGRATTASSLQTTCKVGAKMSYAYVIYMQSAPITGPLAAKAPRTTVPRKFCNCILSVTYGRVKSTEESTETFLRPGVLNSPRARARTRASLSRELSRFRQEDLFLLLCGLCPWQSVCNRLHAALPRI